jgi:hypothetical protein
MAALSDMSSGIQTRCRTSNNDNFFAFPSGPG